MKNQTLDDFFKTIVDEIANNKSLSPMEEGELKKEAVQYFGEAKDFRKNREHRVKHLVRSLNKISNDYENDTSDLFDQRITPRVNSDKIVSPALRTVINKKVMSGWIPHATLEPQQRAGNNLDVYLAQNLGKVHEFVLNHSDFYKEARKGGYDMFVKGRMWLQKGYEGGEGEERVKRFKFKHIVWEKVYQTPDEEVTFIRDEVTKNQAVRMLGEDVKKFEVTDTKDFMGQDVEYKFGDNHEKKEQKRIELVTMYIPSRKIKAVFFGGKLYEYTSGDLYPCIDEYGEGRLPIDKFDAYVPDPDELPTGDADLIVDIWEKMSQMYNSAVYREIRSSRTKQIISSDDPEEARKEWMQSEINNMQHGMDVPQFLRTEVGSNLNATTLDTGNDINSYSALRQSMTFDIMMATGVNLEGLGNGAPTAEQEKIRVRRELEVIDENIEANVWNWTNSVKTNLLMLKDVDADFMDKHIDLVDEFSIKYETEGEKGIMREIVNGYDEFPFNIKININNTNQKKQAVERERLTDVAETIGSTFPGSGAHKKVIQRIVSITTPDLDLKDEDFAIPQAQAPEGGLPGQPQIPQLNQVPQLASV